MTTTGARIIAQSLRRLGVSVIFGIVGIPVVEIAEEAINLGIRFVGFRNEQACSYAASVYGYMTGQPGVCLVVGGPGVFHALAGASLHDLKINWALTDTTMMWLDWKLIGKQFSSPRPCRIRRNNRPNQGIISRARCHFLLDSAYQICDANNLPRLHPVQRRECVPNVLVRSTRTIVYRSPGKHNPSQGRRRISIVG